MQEDKIVKRIPTNLVTKTIITSSAEYESNKEYTDEDANIYEKYLQAITNVSIDINNDIEKIKALEDNILDQYNKNVELADKMEQETEKFAKQANTAIEDYNSNAETKTEEFNTNAKEKTDEFNSNATEKKTEISDIADVFDANVEEKTNTFNSNVETKTTEFNNNSNTKTEEFNNNSTEKINAFNSNAEEKIADYNEHVETLTSRIADLEEETEDLYNALNTEQISGTELYIEDAKPYRILNTGINGMYKQETTTGAQLYNYADISLYNNATSDENGWITLTYDNSQGDAKKYLNYFTNNLNLEEDTQYTLIVEIKKLQGSFKFFLASHYNNEGQSVASIIYDSNNLSNNSIKISQMTTRASFEDIIYGLRTFIEVPIGSTCTITFRISVIKDTTITEENFKYEPYTGEIPSPNPNYLQAIEQVESVKLNINNKNLFNKNIGIVYGKHYSLENGELEDYVSDWYQENYINAKPNTTYSISVDGNIVGWLRALEYDANKNFLVGHNFYKFTTDSRCGYLRLSAGKSKLEKLQLEIGEIITQYSEYGLFLSNIDLQGNKLCAVSDTVKDKLLIDRNGNVALQKNVDSINIKETNYNWQNASEAEEGYTAFFTSSLYSILKPNEGLICNCFTYLKYDGNNGFKVKKSNEAISDGGGYKRLYFRLKTERLETNDIAGFKKFLKDNDIIVYYSLATPEIIDLGQLTELPKTFEGINNIWAETNLGNTEIEIEYVQDVKKLLEKQAEQQNARLDNIENLLSTTETSALLLDNMQTDLESEVK